MKDLAMQNDREADILVFVNWQSCGWVIRMEPLSYGSSGGYACY